MKKVIDGKRYDTKAALMLGEADNLGRGVDSTTDFGYWEAGLYRTEKGNYFLSGQGGPMSMFSRSVGQNSTSGGEGIIPMSKEEAFAWAQQHLHQNEIEAEFADMIEDA